MGAKGTEIIIGGVYVAENTFHGANVELSASGGQPRVPDECDSHSSGEEERKMGSLRRSAEPVTIGPGNPRSAECTSWERRSSGMTELSALAGSERWAACDDDGALF